MRALLLALLLAAAFAQVTLCTSGSNAAVTLTAVRMCPNYGANDEIVVDAVVTCTSPDTPVTPLLSAWQSNINEPAEVTLTSAVRTDLAANQARFRLSFDAASNFLPTNWLGITLSYVGGPTSLTTTFHHQVSSAAKQATTCYNNPNGIQFVTTATCDGNHLIVDAGFFTSPTITVGPALLTPTRSGSSSPYTWTVSSAVAINNVPAAGANIATAGFSVTANGIAPTAPVSAALVELTEHSVSPVTVCPKGTVFEFDWQGSCTDASGTYDYTSLPTTLFTVGATRPDLTTVTPTAVSGNPLRFSTPLAPTNFNFVGEWRYQVTNALNVANAVDSQRIAYAYTLDGATSRCVSRIGGTIEFVATATCEATGEPLNVFANMVNGPTGLYTTAALVGSPFGTLLSGNTITFTSPYAAMPTATPYDSGTLSFPFDAVWSVQLTRAFLDFATLTNTESVRGVTRASVTAPEHVCPQSTIRVEVDLDCEDDWGVIDVNVADFARFLSADAFAFNGQFFDVANVARPRVVSLVGDNWVYTVDTTTTAAAATRGEWSFDVTTLNSPIVGVQTTYPIQVSIGTASSFAFTVGSCEPLGTAFAGLLTVFCSDNVTPFTGTLSPNELGTVSGSSPVASMMPSAINAALTSGQWDVLYTTPSSPATNVGNYSASFPIAASSLVLSDSFVAGASAEASALTVASDVSCLGTEACVYIDLVCADGVTPMTGLSQAEFDATVTSDILLNGASIKAAVADSWAGDSSAMPGRYTICFVSEDGVVSASQGPGLYEVTVDEAASGVSLTPLARIAVDRYIGSTFRFTMLENDPNNVANAVPGFAFDMHVCVVDCAGEPVEGLSASAFAASIDVLVTTPSGVVVPESDATETGYPGCYKLSFTPPLADIEFGVYTVCPRTANQHVALGECHNVLVSGPPCDDVFEVELDWTQFRDSCAFAPVMEQGGRYVTYYAVATVSYDDMVPTSTVNVGARDVPEFVVRSTRLQKTFAIRFQRILDIETDALTIVDSDGIPIQVALTAIDYDELTETLSFAVDTWVEFPWQLADASGQQYVDFPSPIQLGLPGTPGTGPEWTVADIDCQTGSPSDPTTCHQRTTIRVRPESRGGSNGWSECDWDALPSGRMPVLRWNQQLECRATGGEPSTCGAAYYADWNDRQAELSIDLGFIDFCAEVVDVVARATSVQIYTADGSVFPAVNETVTSPLLDLVGPASLYERIRIVAAIEPADADQTSLVVSGSSIDSLSIQAFYTGAGAASCAAQVGTTAGSPIVLRENGVNVMVGALEPEITPTATGMLVSLPVIINPEVFAAKIGGCDVAWSFDVGVVIAYSNDGVSSRTVRATQTADLAFSSENQLTVNNVLAASQASSSAASGLTGTQIGIIAGAVVAAAAIAAAIAAAVIVSKAKAASAHARLVEEPADLGSAFSANSAAL